MASLAAMAAICVWAWKQVDPPPVPFQVPLSEFSALRARRHVEKIARDAHPVGSLANSSVRTYILGELKALGIHTWVESMTALRQDSPLRFSGGRVENIVARLPGTANTKAVLLAAHYDSVVEGPGASDDGQGVAVLLETARALTQAPPLKNDVILLFTDGEEPVMMGADAAVTQSQWMAEVGLALNFEARGTCGPSLMFETSRPDGALVREFARAAPYPRAASFFSEVYQRMPVATDFTLFKAAGVPGLNFAFIGNGQFYHTSEDTPDRMDDRSVQHQGSSSLALARHFGSLPLPLAPSPNVAYFNFGNCLLRYPLSAAPFLTAAFSAVFLLAVWEWRRRGKVALAKMLLSWAFVMGISVAALFFGVGYLKLFKHIQPGWADLSFGQVYGRGWLTASLLAPGGLLVFGLGIVAVRHLGGAEICGGVTLIGTAVSSLLVWKFPGASHLGLALLLSGLLMFIRHGWPRCAALDWPVTSLVMIPVLAIWIPLMRYLDAGLGISAWPLDAALCSLIAILSAAAPGNWPIRRFWPVLLFAAAVMMLLLCCGLKAGQYNPRQPQPANIFYALNADTNAAVWATRRERLDPWSAAILGPKPKRRQYPAISSWLGGGEYFWMAPAPVFPLPFPELETIHSECTNGWRVFDLRVRSPRGAPAMLVQFQSDRDTEIMQLDGVPPHNPEHQSPVERRSRYVDLRGLPPEGMTLRVRIRGCGKLLARLVERSYDLGVVFPNGVPPLLPGAMTAWEDDYYNRSVMVTRRVTIE